MAIGKWTRDRGSPSSKHTKEGRQRARNCLSRTDSPEPNLFETKQSFRLNHERASAFEHNRYLSLTPLLKAFLFGRLQEPTTLSIVRHFSRRHTSY